MKKLLLRARCLATGGHRDVVETPHAEVCQFQSDPNHLWLTAHEVDRECRRCGTRWPFDI